MNYKNYVNPIEYRYASKKMLENFSQYNRTYIWRELWLRLAIEEKKSGYSIPDEAIEDMESNLANIDFKAISEYEKQFKHDVVANIHAFGDVAIKAKKYIHSGATSAYVQDNSDIIMMKRGIAIISDKLIVLMKQLSDLSKKYKDVPTLAFTHLQPAQLTTVGKRISVWLYELYLDYLDLKHIDENLFFRGLKGTTGTQDSYKNIFKDKNGLDEAEKNIAKYFSIDKVAIVSTQTYTRKQDTKILNTLASIASTAHKITNDIRILQNMNEVSEGFAKKQVGSSAMPYKRNPIKSERVASLSKILMTLPQTSMFVHSTQWLERTLDDSAARRIINPEGFLLADSILKILVNIFKTFDIDKDRIEKNVSEYMPYMLSEQLIIKSVNKGYDRQKVHERIRAITLEANGDLKLFFGLLKKDEIFKTLISDIDDILNPENYTGFCTEQVESVVNLLENLISEKEINIKIEELEV